MQPNSVTTWLFAFLVWLHFQAPLPKTALYIIYDTTVYRVILGGANFREKLSRVFRINFRGFKFRDSWSPIREWDLQILGEFFTEAFDSSTSPIDASVCCHPRLFLGGKRQARAALLWSRLSFGFLHLFALFGEEGRIALVRDRCRRTRWGVDSEREPFL